MSIKNTVLLTLTATAWLAADAAAQRNRGAALPEVSCPGANANDEARTAQEALNRSVISQGSRKQDYLQDALEQAAAGIREDAANPYHHLHRGMALNGLMAFNGEAAGPEYTAEFPQSTTIQAGEAGRAAVESLDRAVELCAELQDEAAPEREQAIAGVFQGALQRLEAADTAGAVTMWEAVAQMDSTRADAVFNLGVIASARGDAVGAAPHFRRVVALSTGSDTVAMERRAAALNGVLAAGITLFQQERWPEAAEHFAFVHGIDEGNRDAWYNQALALYKGERWTDLVPVALHLGEVDPLNYNAQILLFNAYKALSEQAKARGDSATEQQQRMLALQTLERADALPVQVDNVAFAPAEGTVTVTGTVTGSAAAAGTPIRLEFVLSGPAGEVGRGTASVNAPAKDASTQLQLVVPVTGTPTGFRYRVVP